MTTLSKLDTTESQHELMKALLELLGVDYYSIGKTQGAFKIGMAETLRADEAEAALAVREAENATLRAELKNLRAFGRSLRAEDIAKLDRYAEEATENARLRTELENMKRRRTKAEELVSQLSQLLIRG